MERTASVKPPGAGCGSGGEAIGSEPACSARSAPR